MTAGVLHFGLSDGPLASEHRRLLSTALRRGAASPERGPDDVVDVAAFDERTLTAARRVWRARMVNEHQSAAVFAGLVPQLMEVGATLDTKTAVLRMSMDELRHGALAAEVVEALGGEPSIRLPELRPAPVPEHPGVGPLERVLRNAIFIGCLAETVAVAFTTEERDQTTEPYLKRVITQISADESLHARFGWWMLQSAGPDLDGPARDRTAGWLRTAFRYLEREELREVPAVTPPSGLVEEGQALGVCDNPATRELFYQTVETVIVPGLEAGGIAAADAWRNRAAAS